MRKLIGSVVLGTLLATLPALAAAQRRAATEAGPQHELGLDLAFQYVSVGSGGGSGVRLAAPVDVRVGFLSRSQTMFEGRVAVLWDSNVGAVDFQPGVNVLHQLKRINGGIGKRLPYESAVFRPEAFLAYAFSTSTLPSEFSIGVRLGLSFWH